MVTFPTLKQVAIVGAFIGSGVGGYITARVAKAEAPSTIEEKLVAIETRVEEIGRQVTDIKSDVRLLKCSAGFPGDCPRRP